MKKLIISIAAILTLAFATPALAQYSYNGGYNFNGGYNYVPPQITYQPPQTYQAPQQQAPTGPSSITVQSHSWAYSGPNFVGGGGSGAVFNWTACRNGSCVSGGSQ